MSTSLNAWIILHRFPTGRREHALQRVAQRARDAGWPELAALCEAGMAHERGLRDLLLAYRAGRRRTWEPRLAELDAAIDRTVGGIYRVASEGAETLDGPARDAARALVREVFADGALPFTRLPYDEQGRHVATVLAHLAAPRHAEAIAWLGLGPYAARLRVLNDEFLAAVLRDGTDYPGWDTVRAAQAQGQEILLQVVALVLGRHPFDTDEDLAARRALLGPIVEQNESIRAYLRDRRRVADVDPASGEETTPAPEDGIDDGPAPAAPAPVAPPIAPV